MSNRIFTLEFDHDIEAFQERIASLPDAMNVAFFLALRDIAVGHKVKMVEDRLSSSETDSPWLASRSGDLKKKVQEMPGKVGPDGKNIKLEIKLDHPFAHIHEFGTVGAGGTLPDIVPVRASWLTIPLPFAQHGGHGGTGVGLGSAREVGDEYESTFFDWSSSSKGDQLILYGVNGDLVYPLFVLVKKVSIKARLGFFAVWDEMKKWRTKRLKKALSDAIEFTK